MSRICVTGEALVDYVPNESGAQQWTPGGSGLNTALALARLGVETSFASALSRDQDGMRVRAFMQSEQIDISHAYLSDKACPHVLVSKDAHGIPSYDLHLAGSALEDAPQCWSWSADTLHFHATSFAATLGAGGDAAINALKKTRGQITSSFDPNIRTQVFGDRAAISLLLADRIRLADLVKVSSEDLDALAPGILHDHIISEWRALGPKLLIITRGDKGALAFFGKSQIEMQAPKIKICDTVGAGDTFMGALLAIMVQEQVLGVLPNDFSSDQIARWLSFACHAAAICCTRPGADPPNRKDMALS